MLGKNFIILLIPKRRAEETCCHVDLSGSPPLVTSRTSHVTFCYYRYTIQSIYIIFLETIVFIYSTAFVRKRMRTSACIASIKVVSTPSPTPKNFLKLKFDT